MPFHSWVNQGRLRTDSWVGTALTCCTAVAAFTLLANSVHFLVFGYFVGSCLVNMVNTTTTTTKSSKNKKPTFGVNFRNAGRNLTDFCSVNELMNDSVFWSRDPPRFCAIACRAVTSHACALLTPKYLNHIKQILMIFLVVWRFFKMVFGLYECA